MSASNDLDLAKPNTARLRVNLDWTRDDFPIQQLTPYQRLIRDVDWTKSPLGPMNKWPDQLRQNVLTLIADPLAAIIYWGDQQGAIYNESYIQLIGSKHPGLLGQNPRIGGFAELWDPFDEIILEGERTGRAHCATDNLVYIARHDYLEEAYFSYKFIPLVGPEGYVIGARNTVTETTSTVITQRRAKFTQQLTDLISPAKDVASLWNVFMQAFEHKNDDLPFTLLYKKLSLDPSVINTESDSFVSISEDVAYRLLAPPDVSSRLSHADTKGFAPAMRRVAETQAFVHLSLGDESFPHALCDDFTWKGRSCCIESVVLWPIISNSEVIAILIFGLNPCLRFDTPYRQWLQQIVQEVFAFRLAKLLLEEEYQNRIFMAEKAELEKARFFDRLREQKRFSKFADRTSVGLCITDINGRIDYANDSWYDFSGLKTNPDLRWIDSVVAEDRAILEEVWTGVTVDRTPQKFQCRSKQPFRAYSEQNGEMSAPSKTAYCVAYPECDENGNVISVMGIIVDISELKWIENQVQIRTRDLEASEKKYRRFAEHAPVGLCRLSLDGRVDFVNQSWIELFGYDPDRTKRLPFLEMVHPDDVAICESLFDLLCIRSTPIHREIRLRRNWSPGGQERTAPQPVCLMIAGHSEAGSDGVPHGLVWWCTDISQTKAASKALTERMEEAVRKKAQQEMFIDMISHELRNPMSAIMSAAEEILQVSRSHEEIWSLDISHSAEMRNIKQIVSDLETDRRNAIEVAHTILFCVEYQKQIIEDVLVLSKLDADMLETAPSPTAPMQLLHHSLKLFSREFRALNIQTSVIKDPSLSEHKLDWAYLDSQKFFQVLINLILTAINSVREAAIRHISIDVSASASKPDAIGAKYFESSQSEDARSRDDPDSHHLPNDMRYLMVKFTDTGKGLTDEEEQALVDKLATPRTLVRYGEAGLGLFIARRIIGMMHGKLGFVRDGTANNILMFYIRTSQTSKESSMEFEQHKKPVSTLSLLPDSRLETSPTSTSRHRMNRAGADMIMKNGRVLLVEDNLMNQKIACKQLQNHGFDVTVANHGVEAIEALQKCLKEENYFDIMLTDVEMPIMDGVACVEEIRRLESTGLLRGRLPILAVTANARREQIDRVLSAGTDGVITKPYRINQLIAEIQKYTP